MIAFMLFARIFTSDVRIAILIAVVVGAGAAACGSAQGHGDDNLVTDSGDNGGQHDATPVEGGVDATPSGPYDDFPTTPYFAGPSGAAPAPSGSPGLFGPAGSGASSGGPCLIEPEVGSLFPRNWLRPRFRFAAAAGENLFEIRLHTTAEKSDLVAYTTDTTWTIPADVWTKLSTHAVDVPITMTVRGATYDATSGKLSAGPSVGTSGDFSLAPADASGTIVYWITTGAGEPQLKGFQIGEETVHDVLKPSQIGSACVGCHASTPDGQYVAMSSSDNPGDGSVSAWVEVRSLKDPTATPPFMTANAKSLLARKDQHGVAFSKAHWAAGDHTIVTGLPVAGKTELIWTDLESTSPAQGTGWDVIARGGDPGAAGGASWSHDGKTLLYFSAPAIGAGLIDGSGQSDLWIVPYGDKKGGAATALVKDGAWSSFYPQFSADDAYVAFNRVPRGSTSYNDAAAEVFVVPATGGTPSRLVANDAPKCMGGTSPGLTNSWPKWSPKASVAGSKTYYWLTFSSTRGVGNPQLYVAPIVVSGGSISTYPALYLWNQPSAEHNHTPAWDVFDLPIH
jgi:hypothetical protein